MTSPSGQPPTVTPGDPFGTIKEEKTSEALSPREAARVHARDDVDSGPLAHHHTLGISRNQSSSGDHVHDGVSSRKLGFGQDLAISGAKGGNAALASVIALLKNFIEFTDNTTA
jgi:hypothetical protein